MGRFEGQVVVIAGGAGGIGAAVCERARSEGARVISWDRAQASALDEACSVICDLTDEASVDTAFRQTWTREGRIDALINCVGIVGPSEPVEALSLTSWRQVMTVNLDSVFLASRAVIGAMRARNYGRIVNLASIAGKEGNAHQSAYSASKAAVIALTKSLGKELADTGIRVNCMTPAIIATAMNEQMTDEMRETVLCKVPMGRPGRADEVAAMALWLASAECSFSTGAVFDISGGRATY